MTLALAEGEWVETEVLKEVLPSFVSVRLYGQFKPNQMSIEVGLCGFRRLPSGFTVRLTL